MGYYAPSEEELNSGNNDDYPVLPEDEYIAKITKIESKMMRNNFPTKNDEADPHEMLQISFDAESFANGDPLVDDQDAPIDHPLPFSGLINPKKVGMLPQPSKTRKFFAAALGQSIGDSIRIDDYQDLVGTKLIVSIKENKGYNQPQDFRPIRRSRSRGTTAKGPQSADKIMAAAKEIFDEDAPENVSPLRKNEDDLDF